MQLPIHVYGTLSDEKAPKALDQISWEARGRQRSSVLPLDWQSGHQAGKGLRFQLGHKSGLIH